MHPTHNEQRPARRATELDAPLPIPQKNDQGTATAVAANGHRILGPVGGVALGEQKRGRVVQRGARGRPAGSRQRPSPLVFVLPSLALIGVLAAATLYVRGSRQPART
jgi:hypothetical protein